MVRVITRQSFFSKYRSYILSATPVVILLLGVAVTYSLVQQQNDVRSRASLPTKDENVIFNDSLISGWTDKSTGAKNTFNLTGPVFSGDSAIAFNNAKGFGSFYLFNETALNLPYWGTLNFSMQAGNLNENYSVSIVDANGDRIGKKLFLSNLGGNPQMGSWKSYSIPLSSFGIIDQPISGVIIQDETGIGDNTVYIDEIYFKVVDAAKPN